MRRIFHLAILVLLLVGSARAQVLNAPGGGAAANTTGSFFGNVNNVINAGMFPGTDIGAKVNYAVAALPKVVLASTTFSGYISGTTLTVASLAGTLGGGVDVGMDLSPTAGVLGGTLITGRGSGVGGTGTYVVNQTQTVGSSGAPVNFSSQYAYPYGTVYIPPTNPNGIQRFATTIGGAPGSGMPVMSFVALQCDHGTQLQYTGSGPDWIAMQDPYAENGESGGVYDCTFIAPATPVANQNMIHFGNQHSMHFMNDTFMNLNAANDNAILLENTVYFTEGYVIHNVDFLQNTNAVVGSSNCATGAPNCGPSVMHAKLSYYCGTGYNNVGPESCLYAKNGIGFQNENFEINFNLNGPDPNTSVVRVDGNHPALPQFPNTSAVYQNVGTFAGENDTTGGGGLFFYSQNSGYFEQNWLNSVCLGCMDAAPFYASSGTDAILGAGPAPIGSYPGNVYLTQIDQIQQAFNGISLTCEMVTGGTCTTAPTVEMAWGSNLQGTLVCPTTIGQTRTTNVTQSNPWYPDSPAFMIMSSPGTACTTPNFTVTFHYRAY